MKLIPAITKSALVLCSILALSTAQANTMHEDDIHCPSLDIVRAGASTLSHTQKDNDNGYVVMGLFPIYSDKYVHWHAVTEVASAKDDEEAIAKGREIVANVETRFSDTPDKDPMGNLACTYYSGPVNHPTARVEAMGFVNDKTAALIHAMVKQIKMNNR